MAGGRCRESRQAAGGKAHPVGPGEPRPPRPVASRRIDERVDEDIGGGEQAQPEAVSSAAAAQDRTAGPGFDAVRNRASRHHDAGAQARLERRGRDATAT